MQSYFRIVLYSIKNKVPVLYSYEFINGDIYFEELWYLDSFEENPNFPKDTFSVEIADDVFDKWEELEIHK